MAKPKRHYPTPAELDERVSIPVPPDELVDGILKAGPHPDDGGPVSKSSPPISEDRGGHRPAIRVRAGKQAQLAELTRH